MIKFFRKIRRRLLDNGNFSRYLLYAAGEIFLVVVGILIALQINNWNETRKNNKQLDQILTTIRQDLVSDTLEVRLVLDNYEARKSVFDRVLSDSATMEDYRNQPFFGVLVTTFVPVTIEKRGYDQLNAFNNFTNNESEFIVSQVTEFYTFFLETIARNKTILEEDSKKNLEFWKEEKDWFAEISQSKLPGRYFDYVLGDPDYKNRVAFHRLLVYGNYTPYLDAFQTNALELIKLLDKELKK